MPVCTGEYSLGFNEQIPFLDPDKARKTAYKRVSLGE